MKQEYLSLTLSIERLHRRFLDVIKSKLDRLGIDEVNNIQSLILYNIGETVLTIGELTNRGYYLGSNVSYNLKKLVENGYVVQERSAHDKRSVRIKLSEKGINLCKVIDELIKEHVEKLPTTGINSAELESSFQTLKKLETFWTDQVTSQF
jgi:DNA-binding MarR family transcriptional regulator